MQTADVDVVVDETKDLVAVEITILVYGSSYFFYSAVEMDLVDVEMVAAMTTASGSFFSYSSVAETA